MAARAVRLGHAADIPFGVGIYSDQGCELAPSCLNCPFVVCQYDSPAPPAAKVTPRVQLQQTANDEVRRMLLAGVPRKVIMQRTGRSKTSVARVAKTIALDEEQQGWRRTR